MTSHAWTFSDKGPLDRARRELGRAWALGLDGHLTERPGDFVLVVRHRDRAALVFDRWVRSTGLRFPQREAFRDGRMEDRHGRGTIVLPVS